MTTNTSFPIKERSLEIFGDEKRLDALQSTSLFRRRRLDLVKDLKCETIGEPLAWKRGPSKATSKPIIVIENAGDVALLLSIERRPSFIQRGCLWLR